MNNLDPSQRFSDSDIAASDYEAERVLREAREEVKRRRQERRAREKHLLPASNKEIT